MDIKKVQAATFAVKNRLLGYKLLRNPKGASPYQVNMIKSAKGVSSARNIYSNYYIKSRDFSDSGNVTQNEKLLTARYRSFDNNGKNEITETYYEKYNTKGEIISKSKATINHNSKIKKKSDCDYDLTQYNDMPIYGKMPFIETLADKILNVLFNIEAKETCYKTPSFWKVLKQNLSAKPN